MSGSITAPAIPSTVQTAQGILGQMFSRTGVLSDAVPGSIIRTYSEAVGATVEQAGIAATTAAFQGGVLGAYSVLGIAPSGATYATGVALFATSLGAFPPPASQSVAIGAGTILQTTAGTQFQTTVGVTLPSGSSSVTAPIIALVPGVAGNISASGISQILTGISYPLFATNPLPTAGGSAAESPSQTASRFAARIASFGLCSPISIANAVIGVTTNGETVYRSSVYEPWVTAGSGFGFTLYLDNGTGSATSALIAAVSAYINASPGYRPAGVPYSILSVNPIFVSASVSGSLYPQFSSNSVSISNSVSASVASLFSSLNIGQEITQGQVAAAAANGAPNELSALIVNLSSGASLVLSSPSGRIILSELSVNIS